MSLANWQYTKRLICLKCKWGFYMPKYQKYIEQCPLCGSKETKEESDGKQ